MPVGAELIKTGLLAVWAFWAEQYVPYNRFLPRPTRKESNVPNLKSSKELTVLKYIYYARHNENCGTAGLRNICTDPRNYTHAPAKMVYET